MLRAPRLDPLRPSCNISTVVARMFNPQFPISTAFSIPILEPISLPTPLRPGALILNQQPLFETAGRHKTEEITHHAINESRAQRRTCLPSLPARPF
jgi:hypothetical protein